MLQPFQRSCSVSRRHGQRGPSWLATHAVGSWCPRDPAVTPRSRTSGCPTRSSTRRGLAVCFSWRIAWRSAAGRSLLRHCTTRPTPAVLAQTLVIARSDISCASCTPCRRGRRHVLDCGLGLLRSLAAGALSSLHLASGSGAVAIDATIGHSTTSEPDHTIAYRAIVNRRAPRRRELHDRLMIAARRQFVPLRQLRTAIAINARSRMRTRGEASHDFAFRSRIPTRGFVPAARSADTSSIVRDATDPEGESRRIVVG